MSKSYDPIDPYEVVGTEPSESGPGYDVVMYDADGQHRPLITNWSPDVCERMAGSIAASLATWPWFRKQWRNR